MSGIGRREFLIGFAASGGACAIDGCRTRSGRGREKVRDYFCTWETQRALWKGKTCERDNMNEEVLFGNDGWADLFPDAREGLVMVLDDGWDVPYGAVNKGDGYAVFGALTPNAARFPSLTGTTVSKLRQLRRRLEDRGWGGLGIWVAAQAYGETHENQFPKERLIEDLKRKLSESAEAGVAYWKVDWGVHGSDIEYRQWASELARSYAPDLIVDHSCGFDNAVNGHAYPYDPPWTPGASLPKIDGETGRMIGTPGFERVRRQYTAMMSYSDSFRTYDTLPPMTSATALERAVFELQCADATKSPCTINVEDEPLIGAALGLGIGVMRAAVWPDPKVSEPDPKQRRIAEITRCVRWRKYAPVFGSDRGCPVLFSAETGEETWYFKPGSTWWSAAFGKTLRQVAPSVVSRGLPLPEVRCGNGERPLVCASRSPDTGSLAVASLPMLTVAKGRHTPQADVFLDAALSRSTPLGIFGDITSVTVQDGAPSARVFARDLAGGADVDITDRCRRSMNMLTIPGEALSAIGRSANPSEDCSSPGVVVSLL